MSECENLTPRQILDEASSTVQVMSTAHFAYLHRALGYTGHHTTELMAAARRFSERSLPSVGLSTPYVTVDFPYYDEKELLAAWNAFISELRRLNLLADVCNYIEQLRIEKQIFRNIVANYWVDMLLGWAMDHADIPHLDISQHNIKDLKIIVMQHWISSALFKLHKIPVLTEYTKADTWEDYILNIRTKTNWMTNTKRLYQSVNFWVDIFTLLSPGEVMVLEKWGQGIVSDRNYASLEYHFFSVVQLAEDLRSRNYLR